MDIKAIIRLRIKQRRLELKLTQEELGRKLNTTKSSISNYENGHSFPTNESLASLAKVLHTSTDWLLGLTDDPTPRPLPPLNNETLIVQLDKLLEQSKRDGKVYIDDSKQSYMEYDDILWLKAAYEKSIKKEND